VQRWLEAKRLRALHRGVYFMGPLLLPPADVIAAVLACGAAAVVSHWSAAALWELLPPRDRAAPVDISLPRGDRRRPGIRIHRVCTLPPDEVTKLDGIPITTPARTLLDVASALPRRELERALAQALGKRLVRRPTLIKLLNRHARHPGARRLRALLESAQPAFTHSEAEEHFLALLRKAQLPMPEVNAPLGGYKVDFFWRAERLVTEIDGFAYHSSTDMFESDRRRDAVLATTGVRVIRVTWRQLVNEPEAVLVRLALALARTAPG